LVSTSASQPLFNGKVPHLLCCKDEIGEIVLLPGDPGRVALFKELCDDFQVISQNREFTVGTGYYRGLKISVCSTGIGAPSTEIAVIQLISLGVKALIRIGGTGAIQGDIPCGSYVINTGAMRMGGASNFYAPIEYPAIASLEAVDSLRRACETRNNEFRMGICASVGSFYHGQGRSVPFENDFNEKEVLDKYMKLKVLNLEMESETIFTLASMYGVYSGSICTVHCNRITDVWMIENLESQREMCETALLGSYYLNETYLAGKK
jgi:uridine phosphorylase